jgi:predicted nucleic acid-binding protein
MMQFGAVLDACAIFPASLRDTLLRAADINLYIFQITDEILEEMRRNLVNKGMLEAKAQKLVNAIRKQFPKAFVTEHRQLTTSMPVNEKDKHVLAAAVASGARVIVTQNLKDFPPHLLAPFNIKALSPDEFLVRLGRLNSKRMAQIIIEQASELRNPPKTVSEVLDALKQHAPKFVSLIRHELKREDAYPFIIIE